MYVPKHFEEKDLREIEALVKEFSFATLVSAKDGIPCATHIPLELEIDAEGRWLLHGRDLLAFFLMGAWVIAASTVALRWLRARQEEMSHE